MRGRTLLFNSFLTGLCLAGGGSITAKHKSRICTEAITHDSPRYIMLSENSKFGRNRWRAVVASGDRGALVFLSVNPEQSLKEASPVTMPLAWIRAPYLRTGNHPFCSGFRAEHVNFHKNAPLDYKLTRRSHRVHRRHLSQPRVDTLLSSCAFDIKIRADSHSFESQTKLVVTPLTAYSFLAILSASLSVYCMPAG